MTVFGGVLKIIFDCPAHSLVLRLIGVVIFFGLLVSGPESAIAGPTEHSDQRRQILVIGKVSNNPKKHYRYLKPIADYVTKQMSDLGISEARVLMARDNEQMIRYLMEGKIDWVTETIFSAIIYKKYADAEFLVKKWKKGVPDYRTVFFTRKDSPIFHFSDLVGKKIAFEDMGSSTAFYYPASALIKEGLELVQLTSPMEQAPEGKVGYVFSNQEINTSSWVYRKMADAGTFNNLDWEKDDHIRASFREEMRIFHTLPPLPRAIEVVRKDLDPVIKNRLKELLLKAHEDPKAKRPLWAYQQTDKFEEIDQSDQKNIDEISILLRLVQSEIK